MERPAVSSLLAAIAVAEHAAALQRILATAQQARREAEALRGPGRDPEEQAVIEAAVAETMAEWGAVA